MYSEYVSYSLNFLGIEIRHGIQIKSNKHKIEIENIENIEIEKKIKRKFQKLLGITVSVKRVKIM